MVVDSSTLAGCPVGGGGLRAIQNSRGASAGPEQFLAWLFGRPNHFCCRLFASISARRDAGGGPFHHPVSGHSSCGSDWGPAGWTARRGPKLRGRVVFLPAALQQLATRGAQRSMDGRHVLGDRRNTVCTSSRRSIAQSMASRRNGTASRFFFASCSTELQIT